LKTEESLLDVISSFMPILRTQKFVL